MIAATILVGDIGSTKSTWRYFSDHPEVLSLSGYNPVTQDDRQGEALFHSLAGMTQPHSFDVIWYYGAGVIDHRTADAVREQLTRYFPKSVIHVASDLTGAAIAVNGYHPGCVAILGTGSHAAVFDGHRITKQATALGYILGDEGGGTDIGKALLQAYFYQEMPDPIAREMKSRLPEGREAFLKALKTSPAPNQYLADFARVAVLFQEHDWISGLVRDRFNLFVKRHIVPLEPVWPVHVVGSIGCIFAGLIQSELEQAGLQAGMMLKDPVQRLFDIHQQHGQTKI